MSRSALHFFGDDVFEIQIIGQPCFPPQARYWFKLSTDGPAGASGQSRWSSECETTAIFRNMDYFGLDDDVLKTT
jgi:hypothetical protein